MEEMSSRYVDNIAINKLINSKLMHVKHNPYESLFRIEENLFNDYKRLCNDVNSFDIVCEKDITKWSFKSPVVTPYEENNRGILIRHNTEKAIGNIILVHGIYEDNISIYQYLISLLNKMNLDVYLMVLPYHYDRKPLQSFFSGEYFMSSDVARWQWAIKQAAYDLEVSFKLVKNHTNLPTMITAYSMGGCVAMVLASIWHEYSKIFLINPVSRLSDLIWNSPLLETIKKELLESNYDLNRLENIMHSCEPLILLNKQNVENKFDLAYSLYDQILPRNSFERVIQEIKPERAIQFNAGHLNILRVPKLANDILNTFRKVM